MHPVRVARRRGDNGVEVETWDEGGAVFVPSLERGVTRPVYAYGHGKVKDPVFTCPVSAIPEGVWSIVDLWLTCRAMKALPKAGGVLDQPLVIRRAWPVLEAEMAPLERERDQSGHASALAAILASVVGRRR